MTGERKLALTNKMQEKSYLILEAYLEPSPTSTMELFSRKLRLRCSTGFWIHLWIFRKWQKRVQSIIKDLVLSNKSSRLELLGVVLNRTRSKFTGKHLQWSPFCMQALLEKGIHCELIEIFSGKNCPDAKAFSDNMFTNLIMILW